MRVINADPVLQSYVIGLALGDGNLSNPNGRAVRLRISCDTKYQRLMSEISLSLQRLLPQNKVSFVRQSKNCIDVACYSNHLEELLGWKALGGSKHIQNVRVPAWVRQNIFYSIECLRGLIQTDGSIYIDRGYTMVNFVTIIPDLAKDVFDIITKIGFRPRISKVWEYKKTKHPKYTVRVAKEAERFIRTVGLYKE